MSENSSLSDIYAVVDKKKKSSAPSLPITSTHPVHKHDYEDVDNDLPPKIPAPYHSDVMFDMELNNVTTRKTTELHSNDIDVSNGTSSNRYVVGSY